MKNKSYSYEQLLQSSRGELFGPESSHAAKWRDIGATHLAIATHNAGTTDVDGHLSRIQEYLDAVNS